MKVNQSYRFLVCPRIGAKHSCCRIRDTANQIGQQREKERDVIVSLLVHPHL